MSVKRSAIVLQKMYDCCTVVVQKLHISCTIGWGEGCYRLRPLRAHFMTGGMGDVLALVRRLAAVYGWNTLPVKGFPICPQTVSTQFMIHNLTICSRCSYVLYRTGCCKDMFDSLLEMINAEKLQGGTDAQITLEILILLRLGWHPPTPCLPILTTKAR